MKETLCETADAVVAAVSGSVVAGALGATQAIASEATMLNTSQRNTDDLLID